MRRAQTERQQTREGVYFKIPSRGGRETGGQNENLLNLVKCICSYSFWRLEIGTLRVSYSEIKVEKNNIIFVLCNSAASC